MLSNRSPAWSVSIRLADDRLLLRSVSVIFDRDRPASASPRAPFFGPEVIEGADIVLLSHTHWDHITDLAYVMEKIFTAWCSVAS